MLSGQWGAISMVLRLGIWLSLAIGLVFWMVMPVYHDWAELALRGMALWLACYAGGCIGAALGLSAIYRLRLRENLGDG